ncbi:hypothetical protein LCGC14_0524650 [marine sediment metagenome]|uniref:Uncharacterized protein n=1 Tax=marine sediment metagenome TaxID=412755 RepID=A0A0F9RXK0_9ZZZZ
MGEIFQKRGVDNMKQLKFDAEGFLDPRVIEENEREKINREYFGK